MDIGLEEDDEVTDIREQMFHNSVREQIVSKLQRPIFIEEIVINFGQAVPCQK